MVGEIQRIQKIMEVERLTPSMFAAEIGVGPSLISHALSGRNKPSLELLKRILERFRTISSDWLILGIGAMYRTSGQSQQAVLFDNSDENRSEPTTLALQTSEKNVQTSTENRKSSQQEATFAPKIEKTVTKVVVFYSDNTFEEIGK